MMTPRTNPDLIPGAPWWINAMVKFGAFGIIAALCAMMVYQNRETSATLLASNLASVDRLPIIAEKISGIAERIETDSSSNAAFMREHTATAVKARTDIDLKLTAIDLKLTVVQQEIASLRSEQQQTAQAIIATLQKLSGESKKAPLSPSSNDGDG
jgi:hypothetical protein